MIAAAEISSTKSESKHWANVLYKGRFLKTKAGGAIGLPEYCAAFSVEKEADISGTAAAVAAAASNAADKSDFASETERLQPCRARA